MMLARLLLAFFLCPAFAAQAETTEKRPLCLVIANGWTLTVQNDGSAILFRTQKTQLRSLAPAGTFPYEKLVEAIEKETKANPSPPASSVSYYFAEFDKAAIVEIAPIPKIRETLDLAQSIFLSSISPLIRQLLNQYPLIGISDPNNKPISAR